jgi:hypothetical protein
VFFASAICDAVAAKFFIRPFLHTPIQRSEHCHQFEAGVLKGSFMEQFCPDPILARKFDAIPPLSTASDDPFATLRRSVDV